MKVLVTGGAGFVGSHIADECVRRGHEVVIVDDLSNGSLDNVNPKAKFVQMDISDPSLHELFEAEKFDAISHCAAQIKVPKSVNDPVFDAKVNILGTVNLLQAARLHGVKKIVFSSSAALYGTPDYLPEDEAHPIRPLSFYGLSKKVDEEYIQMFAELFGISYTIFRYANIFGPRQWAGGDGSVVSIFIERMLKKEEVHIEGDGGATRDFIYVGDVARTNADALTWPENDIYNLSTEREVSVNELFATLKSLLGYEKDPVHVAPRIGDIYRSVMSNQKLIQAKGWKQEVSFEEGLKSAIAWGQTVYE